MNTPICDFVESYAQDGNFRLHMPGHKGQSFLGFERLDITEISGADSLYEAQGIIRESERNASTLFGAETFYSAEGSSLAIRAMLYLLCLYAKKKGEEPFVLAGRNAHKAFLSAAALLGLEVEWLCGEGDYLSCGVNASFLEKRLSEGKKRPTAVYLTSPDYLGGREEISALAEICHRYGVLLLVDCAHGAYLRFLDRSCYPTDLGADLCCASAHKSLPVLTGGAYLSVSRTAPASFAENAKDAMAFFGSTSPSYLILQSLDRANAYLAGEYRESLKRFVQKTEALKTKLKTKGFDLLGDEPLKITLAPKSYGYKGFELAEVLERAGLFCEFCDPDFTVLMLTPENGEAALKSIEKALCALPRLEAVKEAPPFNPLPERVMSLRDAYFAESESVAACESVGRVLARANVSCPPAVPLVMAGERISEDAVKCFEYYGIETCKVVK